MKGSRRLTIFPIFFFDLTSASIFLYSRKVSSYSPNSLYFPKTYSRKDMYNIYILEKIYHSHRIYRTVVYFSSAAVANDEAACNFIIYEHVSTIISRREAYRVLQRFDIRRSTKTVYTLRKQFVSEDTFRISNESFSTAK